MLIVCTYTLLPPIQKHFPKILFFSKNLLVFGMFLHSIILGSLNDFKELPGIANVVGELLNHFGTSTFPGQKFSEIINSRLTASVLEYMVFPETDEDKQLFHFEIDADHLTPALEMYKLRRKPSSK